MTWRQYVLGWAAFALIVTTLGIGIGCIVFYGLLDRAPPRANIVGVASKPAYHACEFFDGTWTMDFLAERSGKVIRRLTSKVVPELESYLGTEDVRTVSQRPYAIPAANFRVPVASFRIPCQWPPGEAFYHVTVEFYNNWFQQWLTMFAIRMDYPVISFTVLPPIATGMLRGDQR
jgi:hypothetical protein